MQPEEAIAFIGSLFVCSDLSASERHAVLIERDMNAYCAAGASLTECAVADRYPLRLSHVRYLIVPHKHPPSRTSGIGAAPILLDSLRCLCLEPQGLATAGNSSHATRSNGDLALTATDDSRTH